ncbi:MAG: anthranilate synthase component I [Nitrospirae bacterium]|nr:anthranilate synthase component I [Nitrospirota bacterium]
MYQPSYEEFCKKAKKGNLVPVYREILADLETPVSAFLKIDDGKYSYLLESVEGGEKWGRYSFLGTSPFLIIRAKNKRIEIIKNGKKSSFDTAENPLLLLKRLLREYKPVAIEGLPPFFGGAVGYLAYDMIRHFEDISLKKRASLELPDIIFMFTDTLLIFDNIRQRIKVVSNALVKEKGVKKAYNNAKTKIDGIIDRLKTRTADKGQRNIKKDIRLSSNYTKKGFEKAVEKSKEYIKAGDIFQVVLSQRFSTGLKSEPFNVYRALRAVNPSPYMFFLRLGDFSMAGSSPEVLVRCENSEITLRPIAGTRKRGKTAEEDKALENELLADPKERAEHIMLVDLGRNDVGRVSEIGSVKVDELMVIERYSHVMHIVSNIKGRLKKGMDAFDVIMACFPAGTVSGAPKIRAMQIIDELEPTMRGPYAGAVGYFSFSNNMDTCINIRSVIMKAQTAYIQAGAGIVADSVPSNEYQETVNKAKAMVRAIEMAEEGLICS